MLQRFIAVFAVVALAFVVGQVGAAEPLKSGPQVGEELAGPFHPLNVNGEGAGKKVCLYCKNGSNPVAMVFARETSAPLTKLIKKLDACTDKHSDCKMGSFVVFLNDSEDLNKQLKEMADKQGLKQTVLAIDNPAGPKGYNVDKDADVTVVLYTDRMVKANHSFRKGELKEKNIDQIVADVTKILPKQ